MFSGGAAVDWKNVGGWKTGKHDVIIATWTSTGRGECIAYSNDKGRTFIEYEGNPIIRHGGRDPKPLWYTYGPDDKPLDDAAKKLGGHWVIAVYDHNEKDGRNVAFYTSSDLKEWTVQSHLSGYYECAELFSLPVDDDKNEVRWVVFGADAEYAVGDFDGKTFTPEHEGKHRLHHGNYYASQLFSDAPDGRRIQIGWAKIPMGDSPFNQTFSFPTELSLRTTKDGVRMFGEPVREIEKIHGKRFEVAEKTLMPDRPIALETSGALLDIQAEFELGTAKTVGLEVDGKKGQDRRARGRRQEGRHLRDGKRQAQRHDALEAGRRENRYPDSHRPPDDGDLRQPRGAGRDLALRERSEHRVGQSFLWRRIAGGLSTERQVGYAASGACDLETDLRVRDQPAGCRYAPTSLRLAAHVRQTVPDAVGVPCLGCHERETTPGQHRRQMG
jgi:sucrose-6-phosphate hydrolase SacC (GH32 family)